MKQSHNLHETLYNQFLKPVPGCGHIFENCQNNPSDISKNKVLFKKRKKRLLDNTTLGILHAFLDVVSKLSGKIQVQGFFSTFRVTGTKKVSCPEKFLSVVLVMRIITFFSKDVCSKITTISIIVCDRVNYKNLLPDVLKR